VVKFVGFSRLRNGHGATNIQGQPGIAVSIHKKRFSEPRIGEIMHADTLRSAGKVLLTIAVIGLASASSALGTDFAALFNPTEGNALFVSQASGKNSNPGTLESPFKNIDKAFKSAAAGDVILVAEGTYSGTFDIGYLESDKPLKLYGGFSSDFSSRDVVKHPAVFRPDNASGGKSRKPLLRFSKAADGVVVDGFIFDMGGRNSYDPAEGKPAGVETGMLLLPPKKASGDLATVTEPCLSIPSSALGGDVMIRNNVFLNCASFGIQAGVRGGFFKVVNNVFVANRMAAIEVYGTCASRGGPGSMTQCGEAEIANNTILFTWSRLKDFLDMGYGVRVMTKLGYNIHHNLIGANIMAGVDHSRFNNNEWVKLDNNVLFVNKKADLEFSPASNTSLDLRADQFEDLELASNVGNTSEIPSNLPVDEAYLEGFLSARYTEEADYDSNSPANQIRSALGRSKQGRLSTDVSMYGNRYPWGSALRFFGAVSGAGAQTVE